MLYENDERHSMRFEGLGQKAFNYPGKGNDPWGYSWSENYSPYFSPPTEKGKRALSTILLKFIFDHGLNSEKAKELIATEERVWKSSTVEEIAQIIDDVISILK